VKRCSVAEDRGIEVGIRTKKECDALVMTVVECEMDCRLVVAIKSVDIGMSIKEDLDALQVAFRRCEMERRELIE